MVIYSMSRIIISLPEELLNELDRFRQERSYNRSECVRHAIRTMLWEKGATNVQLSKESTKTQ